MSKREREGERKTKRNKKRERESHYDLTLKTTNFKFRCDGKIPPPLPSLSLPPPTPPSSIHRTIYLSSYIVFT